MYEPRSRFFSQSYNYVMIIKEKLNFYSMQHHAACFDDREICQSINTTIV